MFCFVLPISEGPLTTKPSKNFDLSYQQNLSTTSTHKSDQFYVFVLVTFFSWFFVYLFVLFCFDVSDAQFQGIRSPA